MLWTAPPPARECHSQRRLGLRESSASDSARAIGTTGTTTAGHATPGTPTRSLPPASVRRDELSSHHKFQHSVREHHQHPAFRCARSQPPSIFWGASKSSSPKIGGCRPTGMLRRQGGLRAEHMHLPVDVHEREALAQKDRYGVVPQSRYSCLRRGCSLRVDSYVEYRALELKRLARQWPPLTDLCGSRHYHPHVIGGLGRLLLDQRQCSHFQVHPISQECVGKRRAINLTVVIRIFEHCIQQPPKSPARTLHLHPLSVFEKVSDRAPRCPDLSNPLLPGPEQPWILRRVSRFLRLGK
jgi:hypothetical protein